MKLFTARLALALLSIASPHAYAAVTVEDPQGVLAPLDKALGDVPWEKRFSLGDQAQFVKLQKDCQFSCKEDGGLSYCTLLCEGVQQPYTRTVASCGPDSLTIYSDDGEETQLSRTELESVNGNLSRLYLAQLDTVVPGALRFVATGVQAAQYKLGAGSARERMVPAFHLTGSLYLKDYPRSAISTLVTVGKDVAGVGQIMRLRILEATWFRAVDITEKNGR